MLLFVGMIIAGAIIDDIMIKKVIASFVPLPITVTILGIVLELVIFKTYKKPVKGDIYTG